MSTRKQKGYYPNFQLPLWLQAPESFLKLLRLFWDQSYHELYEEGSQTVSLVEAINQVFSAFSEQGSLTEHKRLIYMGFALGLASKPTFSAYLPQDKRPGIILKKIETWLNKTETDDTIQELFPEMIHIRPPQALTESMFVFHHLNQALSFERARSSMEEIVDLCLEGYAIFPGSAGRRDLFNWWLLEVVPSAYHLRLPQAIYTMKWPWPPQQSF